MTTHELRPDEPPHVRPEPARDGSVWDAPAWAARDDDVIELPRFHHREGGLLAKVEALREKLDEVEGRGFYLWRYRMYGPSERAGRLGDGRGVARDVVLMSSNNYLGLTTHPRVVSAACEATLRYGTGSGSAPFFSGTYAPHRALEVAIARVKGQEDATLFSSGYAANLGVLTALLREGDAVFVDRLAHASLIDGARASAAKLHVFRHDDAADLDRKLARAAHVPGKLVVLDAIYSMDGDVADLPAILDVAERHGALVLVDEAHSTGVLGARGGGIAEHYGLDHARFLTVGTMSKALGSVGGFFAGPRAVVEYVRHYARSAMFSTALPAPAAAAAHAALGVIAEEPLLLARLRENARTFREGARALGLEVGPTASPIIPVIVGDQTKLLSMGRAMHERGVHVNCVFYPAVARDEARLRFSVMATHTARDLERTLEVLAAVAREHDLARDCGLARERGLDRDQGLALGAPTP